MFCEELLRRSAKIYSNIFRVVFKTKDIAQTDQYSGIWQGIEHWAYAQPFILRMYKKCIINVAYNHSDSSSLQDVPHYQKLLVYQFCVELISVDTPVNKAALPDNYDNTYPAALAFEVQVPYSSFF